MKEVSKDKHGFTVTKHKISIRLFFKFLLTAAVCTYALYRCSLRACADSITLSPEQALALFGAQIDGTYYSQSLDSDIECVAVYVGVSSDCVPADHWGNFYTYSSPNIFSPALNTAVPNIADRQYLIYAICPAYTAGGGALPWPSWTSSGNTGHTNLSVSFPFTVTQTTSLKFSVLYTFGDYLGFYPSITDSFGSLVLSSGNLLKRPLGGSYYNTRVTSLLVPQYFNSGLNAGDIPESYRIPLACIPFDISLTDPFSISGMNLGLNSVKGINLQNGMGVTLSGGLGYCPFLYIECPTFESYIPATTPPQTTPPPQTLQPPMSTAPAETVDLSNLESGVAAIVSQMQEANNLLDWIGYNQYIAAADLDHISSTLDLIYAKMWDAGEVPQNAGLQPPNYDNLRNFAVSALATRGSGVTTVSGFDMSGNFSAFFDVGKSLAGAPIFAPFILAAYVGLAMAVLSFVLFRGH